MEQHNENRKRSVVNKMEYCLSFDFVRNAQTKDYSSAHVRRTFISSRLSKNRLTSMGNLIRLKPLLYPVKGVRMMARLTTDHMDPVRQISPTRFLTASKCARNRRALITFVTSRKRLKTRIGFYYVAINASFHLVINGLLDRIISYDPNNLTDNHLCDSLDLYAGF